MAKRSLKKISREVRGREIAQLKERRLLVSLTCRGIKSFFVYKPVVDITEIFAERVDGE